MSHVKTILAIVAVLILAACGTGAPVATPTAIATNTLQPTTKSTKMPTITPTPTPEDVPIYKNSFEDVTDLAASGITSSDAKVKINTENVDYAGGSKTLEVYGTLPGANNSSLSVDLSIKKLIGEESLDLTDKAINFYAYFPADSPFGKTSIYAGRKGQFVFLGGINADDYWNKGAWHDYQFDLTNVQGLMKDSDTIRIVGQRLTEGASSEVYFLVDTLRWIRSDRFNLPVDDSIDSLRKYAANKHFDFGVYTADDKIFGPENDPWNWKGDPWYAYMAAQEGAVNTLPSFFSVRENEDYSNFDYDRPEDAKIIRQYQFGEGNHMATMGYGIGAMGLYCSAPQWLLDLSFPDATKALLLYHIEKDLRYTKGKNPVWLLFNEFINTIGYGNTGLKNRNNPTGYWDYCNGYSLWAANTTDSSLIKAAFIKAREVDPGATLMLNDADDEDIGWIKSDYFYQFASGLKAEGIPIDGVGFQMHNFIDPSGKLVFFRKLLPWDYSNAQLVDMDTYLNNVDLNVKRYASIGLKVAFTEVEGQIKIDDIDLTTPAGRTEYEKRLQWQAKYFAGLLNIALKNENVILFHMWGGTDRYQNVQPWPGFGNGFIFDKNYNPKPAYYAMLDLLKNN
jgi:hypothetical protein